MLAGEQIILEVDQESKGLTLFCSKNNMEKCTNYLIMHLEEGRMLLRNEAFEVPLLCNNADSARGIIGRGGSCQGILMPGEYRSVMVFVQQKMLSSPDILDNFSKFGLVANHVQFQKTQSSKREIRGESLHLLSQTVPCRLCVSFLSPKRD